MKGRREQNRANFEATIASFPKRPNVHPVDILGNICAQIADLETQRTVAKEDVIKQYGIGTHNGAEYTATVYEGESTTIDQKTIDAKMKQMGLVSRTKVELIALSLIRLGVSMRWVREHTKRTPYVAARTDLIVKTVAPSPQSALKAS